MYILQDVDISGIKIQVLAVYQHRWAAGERFDHIVPKIQNLPLLYQLWLVQQGDVEFHSNGKRWQIKSDEACLIPATIGREIITPKPALWLSLSLRISAFNKFNLLQGIAFPAIWKPDELELQKITYLINEMSNVPSSQQAHHRLMIDGLAHALFGLCWEHLSSASLALSMHSALPDWLARTMHRISAEPASTIVELAHEAGFSPAQFRRVFREHVGATPRDYLTSRRLEVARNYLVQTDLPLRVIAERIGLRDIDHFSMAFKNVYGLSPSHYRAAQGTSHK